MGCANSKQKVCENCQVPLSQRVPRRSKSMHVHHFPEKKGDSYHLVSLTSSTLGSLRLDPLHSDHYIDEELAPSRNVVGKVIEKKSKEGFVLVEAKTWSKWLEEKIPKEIPKIPIQMVVDEPETINAWELMEGLEDTSSPVSRLHDHLRSVSLDVQSTRENVMDTKTMVLEVADHDNESHLHSDSASVIPQFDPEVISTFRKSLEELPPVSPFHLKPLIIEIDEELEVSDDKKMNEIGQNYKFVAREKEKLVLYYTSLRGVRKTYEDCCHVRIILKGLGVKIDEKDVSMHSGFREELKALLGEGYPGGGLPKLFIGTKLIGGAEEIRRMNEAGQLEKLVERCEKLDKYKTSGGGNGGVCEACGDIRFTPCDTCSGSCKIFCERNFDEENEEDEYGFQRCPNCNENGLIRCPVCCD
ncbi:hypothetical protein Leryth_014952 [Lithospermum erythrorhizon]|nr:hypothetical protein Leryth_014952 [Lithospermum erythrorhizon]